MTTSEYFLEGVPDRDKRRVSVETLGYGMLLSIANVNLKDSAVYELSTIIASDKKGIGEKFTLIVYGKLV